MYHTDMFSEGEIERHGDAADLLRRDAFRYADPVEKALEWYGLGDGPKGESVQFVGDFKRYRHSQLEVLPIHEGEELAADYILELPLDQIWFAAVSAERVLVRVPVVFVTIFGLAAFILSPEELADAEQRVRDYNKTFLPPSSDKPAETLGSIRI